MDRLQDRVIIVTGGAHGIGRAYCEGLAREGARVVVADIDGHAAEAVVQALSEAGQEALAVVTDVSQPEDTEHMARAVIERFGRIDGLINNAAVFQRPAMSRVPCSFDAPRHLFLQGERKPNLQPSDPESE